MPDNPEDSPQFDHWRHDGNRLERWLGIGKKTAIYKPMMPVEAAQAIVDANEGGGLSLFGFGMSSFVEVGSGANRKAVPFQRWLKDALEEYEEGKGATRYFRRGTWAYRCIEIRAQSLQRVPWKVIDANDNPVETGDIIKLLEEVNPEANWPDLLNQLSHDLDIHGKGFWMKLRKDNRSGYSNIQRVNPALVETVADSAGIKGFKVGPEGKQTMVPRENMVYFHTYDPDNDAGGLSKLEVARSDIEIELEAKKHIKMFFENHAMGDKLFSLETTDAGTIDRVRREWEKSHRHKNTHGVDFVGGGAVPHDMTYAPEKLALKDVMDQARMSICSVFGVPPTLAGAWDAANYATAVVDQRSLYTETIDPLAFYIAGVISAELVADFIDGGQFKFYVNELDVMQEVIRDKAEGFAALVTSGTIIPAAAVRELHLREEDVGPGPAAFAQAQPVPFRAMPNTNGKEHEPLMDLEKTTAALSKWRRKAMNRYGKGDSPVCDFESEYVTPLLHDRILGQLETAVDKEDIDDVFDDASEWAEYG